VRRAKDEGKEQWKEVEAERERAVLKRIEKREEVEDTKRRGAGRGAGRKLRREELLPNEVWKEKRENQKGGKGEVDWTRVGIRRQRVGRRWWGGSVGSMGITETGKKKSAYAIGTSEEGIPESYSNLEDRETVAVDVDLDFIREQLVGALVDKRFILADF